MNESELIKVLLVEDDEDDYLLTKGYFEEIKGHRFQLDWMPSYERGWEALLQQKHDVCLVDYRLGARTGIDLLRVATERGCKAPIILLTGQGEHEIDLEAMKLARGESQVARLCDGTRSIEDIVFSSG